MIRNFRLHRVFVCVSAFAALLCVVGSRAEAQTKPFKIVGVGVAPDGLPLPGQAARPHWIVGVATHLGLHAGLGSVKTDSAAPNAEGGISGEFGSGSPFVFTRKNGDKLVCNYGRADLDGVEPGEFHLTIVGVTEEGAPIVTALFIAEFVAQPALSTGKFAGVTGSWIMYAWTEPFVLGSDDPIEYGWAGEGKLKFRK